MTTNYREKAIRRVTLAGSAINVALVAFKFVSGVVGCSAAMIADAVHSLSDLLTDAVVLLFVHISEKPQDEDHDYGHGKYETMASSLIGIALLVVGAAICYDGVVRIVSVARGGQLEVPGGIALVAAIASIALKEWAYRFTVSVGRRLGSPAVIANAWHHRSDALSSVGSLVGIAGAMFLGSKWTMLDPLASCCISIAIFVVAVKMAVPSLKELLDVSLPQDMEQKIIAVSSAVPGVMNVHGLKTRRNGPSIIMEAHIVVEPSITVVQAHNIATAVEDALKHSFGNETQISLHIEPGVNAR